MNATLLTLNQTASILQINEHTLNLLVQSGQVPHVRIASAHTAPVLRFNPESLTEWLELGPVAQMNEREVAQLRRRLEARFPEAINALKELNKHCTGPRTPKGYSLAKVPHTKIGFTYYVRYIEKGKLIPSRWSTHTNDPVLAARFAVENRERLLGEYHNRKTPEPVSVDPYAVMQEYYAENSPYLAIDAQRGRTISRSTRRTYQHFMADQWTPYLKQRKVRTFEEIDTPFLARFQNHCLGEGKKPQTIAHYISTISLVFDHLVIEGYVKTNPCDGLTTIKTKESDYTSRGCYETGALRGVFNKPWKDETSYLLCLLIYSTGMRNSEIERIQVQDIIEIGGCRFINIPRSKTKNGVRLAPLHDFVYRKLERYIRHKGKTAGDYLFSGAGSVYVKANLALGGCTKYGKERLEAEHITFYSGRHFWKTLMNARGLGEIEEYFMGHRVSKDVAKRYNHRDKQGQEKIVEKAREVFQILDQALFTRSSL
jgi:integrase